MHVLVLLNIIKDVFHILLYVKRLYAFIIHCDSCKTNQTSQTKNKSGEAWCAALHFVLAALNTARRLMPNGSYCHVAQFTDRYLRSRGTTKKNRRLRRLRKRERERERERERKRMKTEILRLLTKKVRHPEPFFNDRL